MRSWRSWFRKMIIIIGQIRIYSLIDLILFSYAVGAGNAEIIGMTLLHLSFLFYLEHTHKHSYRLPVRAYVWLGIGLMGVVLYTHWAVIGFVFSSILYAQKQRVPFSYFSPLARGFQCYFLAAGIVGFTSPISFIAFVAFTLRNFAGDMRDLKKDKREGMKTAPAVLGCSKDNKFIHPLALFATSALWLYLSGISWLWLVGIYIVQMATYNITPRKD